MSSSVNSNSTFFFVLLNLFPPEIVLAFKDTKSAFIGAQNISKSEMSVLSEPAFIFNYTVAAVKTPSFPYWGTDIGYIECLGNSLQLQKIYRTR